MNTAPKLENREQALKFIQGKLFATTLLGLMDMSMRGPKPNESQDQFARRQAEEMETRNNKAAGEILDAVQAMFLSGAGQTEPASNDTGEETALRAMAGDSHGGPAVAAFFIKRKDVPERMTKGQTDAAILQDEIDRIVAGATRQINDHAAATVKRIGDDLKRLVTGLKISKSA